MATYRMVKRPASSIATMQFNTYAEAQAFCESSQALKPSKPFKHMAHWKVAIIKPMLDKPAYVKVEDWNPPFALYNEWKGLEALYHIPVHVDIPKHAHA